MSQTIVKGQPVYRIGFLDSIKNAFAHFFYFEGKASRKQFWWWTLFVFVTFFVAGFIIGFVEALNGNAEAIASGDSVAYNVTLIILALVFALPNISITLRRLRDAGLSPWLILLNIIPRIGSLIVLVLCAMPTKNKDNIIE